MGAGMQENGRSSFSFLQGHQLFPENPDRPEFDNLQKEICTNFYAEGHLGRPFWEISLKTIYYSKERMRDLNSRGFCGRHGVSGKMKTRLVRPHRMASKKGTHRWSFSVIFFLKKGCQPGRNVIFVFLC